MRISGWSADVCSSDLVAAAEDAGEQAIEHGCSGWELGLMRGRIRTRSLASSSPNEKRAPGALFGNAILYVETPAGGIKPVSGAPDVDHTPARGLIGDVAAHASAVGRGYVPDGS